MKFEHEGLAVRCANRYRRQFNGGYDFDDAAQDARLALWLATKKHDGSGPFYGFGRQSAMWALHRSHSLRMLAVKAPCTGGQYDTRARRRSESLDAPVPHAEFEGESLVNLLPAPDVDPSEALTHKETLAWLEQRLAPRAYAMLTARLLGEDFRGIAARFGVCHAAVQLACQRAVALLRERRPK